MTVFEIVTQKIVDQLEKGTIPWIKPWNGSMNFNGVTGRDYSGINVFILAGTTPAWVSYKQAADLGGNVKKGEKGSIAVFWKCFKETDKETGKEKTIPMLRYYTVFNISQCENLKLPAKVQALLDAKHTRPFNPIAEAETIVNNMQNKPAIVYQEQQAYYKPSTDTLNMPAKGSFKAENLYYETLFHELTHSTGHEKRLNRSGFNGVWNINHKEKAKEELIAEIGAAFLCSKAGIDKIINNVSAYCKSWLQALQNDKRMIVYAASAATKAANYILNVETENKTEE